MAEKQQINPRIPVPLKEELEQYCKDHGVTASEVVESGLRAVLGGQGDGMQRVVLERLTVIEEWLKGLVDVLTPAVPGEEATEPPPPKIATYAEMYGPIEAVPQDEEPVEVHAPSLRGWRRWLYREGA
jgi:hypothetical protein